MPNAINQRIVTLCKEKGYTWYRLSALSGIPVSTIVSIINRNNAPTIPTLQKLCDALGLTLSQFFSEGFETTTKTQDVYLYEFNRLDNHEQDLVLAYIQGMLDAKDIRMKKQAQKEAENIAKGRGRKKGGRKKKNAEAIPAGDETAAETGDEITAGTVTAAETADEPTAGAVTAAEIAGELTQPDAEPTAESSAQPSQYPEESLAEEQLVAEPSVEYPSADEPVSEEPAPDEA